MKFDLWEAPVTIVSNGKGHEIYRVFQVEPKIKLVCGFFDVNMAGDYVDFLNDKYCDKEINQEWPAIDKEARIKYHLEQIELLKSGKPLRWNEHGNEVEGD